MSYGALAVGAALLAALSLAYGTFAGFCLAAYLMGWSAAAAHQYRFAALELVPAIAAPKATSVLLLGGILAGGLTFAASRFGSAAIRALLLS